MISVFILIFASLMESKLQDYSTKNFSCLGPTIPGFLRILFYKKGNPRWYPVYRKNKPGEQV
jgi:hypothetical protein